MIPNSSSKCSSKSNATAFSLEGVEQIIERLGQGRMGEDSVLESGIGKLTQHGDFDHSHDLASLEAKDRATQDLVRVSIDDGLHGASALAGFQGAGHVVHGIVGNADVEAHLTRLFLTDAHVAQLGV